MRFIHSLLLSVAMAVMAPSPMYAETRLPDGQTTNLNGVSAWLIDPVTRYDHGVIGDAIEAGGFQVRMNGHVHTYKLDKDAVFEDRRVRLADLTGDGRPEAIIIKSYLKRGAAIAVFALTDNGIKPLAETAPIGRPHRWLNIAGVVNTPKGPLIAAVITPHLTGSLRLYRLSGRSLRETGRINGYTNHIIGTRNLDLGQIVKGDIILPTIDRRRLALISVSGGKPVLLKSVEVRGQIADVDPARGGTARVRLSGGGHQIVKFK